MGKLGFRKTKILARQMLLSIIDINLIFTYPFFNTSKIYQIPLKKLNKFRIENKDKFKKELYRLKQDGFIKQYINGKDMYIGLTKKGIISVKKYILDEIDIHTPEKWNGKWHIVVFDIPKRKNKVRDYVRNTLEQIGFLKLQESVYVYPFECLDEINYIKNNYLLGPYVQYIIADRIETETNLIRRFLDRDVLTKDMLK
jgi:DNA-binding transcriptional regulator PaaX